MKPSFVRTENGFSVVELVFTILLLFSISLTILPSISSYRKIFDQSLTSVKEQGNLRNAMNVVTRDLREAKQGTGSASCEIDNPEDGVCIKTGPIMSFKVPEATSGGQTSFKTIKFTYDSSAQTITRTEILESGTSTSAVVGRLITAATFTQTSNTAVLLVLTSSSGTVRTQVFLRNY